MVCVCLALVCVGSTARLTSFNRWLDLVDQALKIVFNDVEHLYWRLKAGFNALNTLADWGREWY